MICCLNPDCSHPANPDDSYYCQSCHSKLIPLLRGHYRVIEPLSVEGGFSITYLAEDIDKLKERCVVKQFAPKVKEASALNKAIALFQLEAQQLQKLGEHEQIPTLLAYFEQDDYLFLVQQFVPGQNLKQELQQQGTYSESKIRELLLDLLPILKFIHQRGVIHRDIKPQNIIRRQDDGRLVLIDFGASKQLTATMLTQIGTAIGSHGYIAMEQMQEGKSSPASDLFSLGATCFHMLSGVSPSQVWMEHGYAWVKSWRKYLKKPDEQFTPRLKLGKVLDKMLKIDIDKRYQSADEVINDLINLSPSSIIPATHIRLASSPSGFVNPKLDNQQKKQLLVSGAIVMLAVGGSWYSHLQPAVNIESAPKEPIQKQSVNSDFPITLKGHSSDVNAVVFAPDGNRLFSSSDDQTIKVWNLTTKEELFTLRGHSAWVWAIAVSPNGQILASASADKTIKLWNTFTSKEIRTLGGHSDGVSTVAFSPDGQTLASGSVDKTIKLRNWATGKEILSLTGHSEAVAAIAYSPDGKILASGSWDKSIKFWDLATGKMIRTLQGHTDLIISIAFSPDGKILASGSKDQTIKLWDVKTGNLIRTLRGHKDKVNSVAFVPNPDRIKGHIILSGSSDNTMKLWNVRTGNAIRTFKKDAGYIYSVAISPDGKIIASGGSAENIIKLWQMP